MNPPQHKFKLYRAISRSAFAVLFTTVALFHAHPGFCSPEAHNAAAGSPSNVTLVHNLLAPRPQSEPNLIAFSHFEAVPLHETILTALDLPPSFFIDAQAAISDPAQKARIPVLSLDLSKAIQGKQEILEKILTQHFQAIERDLKSMDKTQAAIALREIRPFLYHETAKKLSWSLRLRWASGSLASLVGISKTKAGWDGETSDETTILKTLEQPEQEQGERGDVPLGLKPRTRRLPLSERLGRTTLAEHELEGIPDWWTEPRHLDASRSHSFSQIRETSGWLYGKFQEFAASHSDRIAKHMIHAYFDELIRGRAEDPAEWIHRIAVIAIHRDHMPVSDYAIAKIHAYASTVGVEYVSQAIESAAKIDSYVGSANYHLIQDMNSILDNSIIQTLRRSADSSPEWSELLAAATALWNKTAVYVDAKTAGLFGKKASELFHFQPFVKFRTQKTAIDRIAGELSSKKRQDADDLMRQVARIAYDSKDEDVAAHAIEVLQKFTETEVGKTHLITALEIARNIQTRLPSQPGQLDINRMQNAAGDAYTEPSFPWARWAWSAFVGLLATVLAMLLLPELPIANERLREIADVVVWAGIWQSVTSLVYSAFPKRKT